MSSKLSSQILTALVLGSTSALLGFYLGCRAVTNVAKEELESIDEDPEELTDGDLSLITAGFLEPCKMVLIVRTDLKMTPGRVSTYCGSATLACYKALSKRNPDLVRHWERTGQAKIALKANSEDQVQELEAIAKSLNLCARSVQDQSGSNGNTSTVTVLAIGPAPVPLVNQVTGNLRLL